jgi:phage portal protein BeeE
VDLLDRVAAQSRSAVEKRFSIDQWISEYLIPSQFGYNGNQYSYGLPLGLTQTLAGNRVQEISTTLPGYSAALKSCPPAFAAQMVRALVLSQARFTFRSLPSASTPRKLFGTRELALLEQPWPHATTGELVARMEWHAGLAGNAYVARRPKRLRVLRPDWCGLVYGSEQEPEDAATALDGELIGLVYQNGGIGSSRNQPSTLLTNEFAHWSPLPDPECAGIGMSWITPAIRDLRGDIAATQHKLRFFENGATPNLVVKGITAATKEQFDEIVDAMEDRHAGVANAYRTLYLVQGADATVVGSDLKQVDFRSTQGGGETRISALSRVHPVILAIAEGMQGSSLNAGNFGMARRIWADTWITPTLQDLSASLATLLDVPADAELWFDSADMPILREDAKDAAEIAQIKAAAIRQLVDGGYDPTSVVLTLAPEWISTLKHTGKLSVQLQEPGALPANGKAALPAGGA